MARPMEFYLKGSTDDNADEFNESPTEKARSPAESLTRDMRVGETEYVDFASLSAGGPPATDEEVGELAAGDEAPGRTAVASFIQPLRRPGHEGLSPPIRMNQRFAARHS